MHVDDVGADGDVHRQRNAQAARGNGQALVRMLRILPATEMRHTLAQALVPPRRATRIASFSSVPVSSAMPNLPGPSAASTSSEVAPKARSRSRG